MKNFWLDRDNKRIREYILNMLGAPCMPVELDEALLNCAINLAEQCLSQYLPHSHPKFSVLLQDGALGFAKHMLGMFRAKFPVRKGLTSDCLLEEAEEDLEEWKAYIAQLAE